MAGWEKGGAPSLASSISELIVIMSDCCVPGFRCFCRTRETIRDLYGAFILALEEYGALFDNPSEWHDPDRFSGLGGKMRSLRMKESIRSEIIEIKTSFEGKTVIDDKCQSPGPSLGYK